MTNIEIIKSMISEMEEGQMPSKIWLPLEFLKDLVEEIEDLEVRCGEPLECEE